MSQYSAKGAAYLKHAAQIKAEGRAANTPCCLCGGAIDYDAHHMHPLAFTVEHRHKLSQGGAYIQDTDVPAHRRCQSRQGAIVRNRRQPTRRYTPPTPYSTNW